MQLVEERVGVREDFPLLRKGEEAPVYLDSAAMALKPDVVIEKVTEYLSEYPVNVHRGIHGLSQKATEEFEKARETVRRFIGAEKLEEIIVTSGATESINMVAAGWGGANLQEGDEVLISQMEHHANFVPWKWICDKTGAKLRMIEVDVKGDIDLDHYLSLLSPSVKMVAVTHASNSIGTINPIREMIQMAHHVGAKVLIDAAQSIVHLPIDVQHLDADFLVFSGHKVLAPTGVGVLYGKRELLEKMPALKGGGSMISKVSLDRITYADLPNRLEAGTPSVGSFIGLGAALEYLEKVGWDRVMEIEEELTRVAMNGFLRIPGLQLIGASESRLPVFSFNLDEIHAHDLGTFLDFNGIAVRSGHHCTQPLMQRYGVMATVRASCSFYNSVADVQRLMGALIEAKEYFR